MIKNKTSNPTTASDWIKEGKLLAYPTESVWGIGCDAFNEQAVKQILAIKHRPVEKGMIVVTDSIERLEPFLARLSESQRSAIVKSWSKIGRTELSKTQQQATTWLLPIPKHISIPTWITGKHNSLAVRVVAHPVIKQLCECMVSADNPFGFIISTSCNPATLPPARTIDEAYAYFGNKIGYLQGETLGYELPSQIREGVSGGVLR